MDGPYDNLDPLDTATRNRLGRLARLPVDTSRISRRLRQNMHEMTAQRTLVPRRWWPVTSAAAAVVAAAVIGVAVLLTSTRAVAGPSDLAQMHEQVVAGESKSPVVHTIADASAALAAFVNGTGSAQMPAGADGCTMPCCEAKLCGHNVASIVLERNHAKVSIMLARRDEMKCRGDGTVVRDSRTYVVGHAKGLNMVMEDRNGRWLCLVGEAPQDQLIDLIRGLAF